MKFSCCNHRGNCIVGSFWLVLYYGVLSSLMFYEIASSKIILYKDTKGRVTYGKNTSGFWMLGNCFVLMVLGSLALVFGSIMRRPPLIMVFLICQIIPLAVELFYLLVALLYGIETEFVFIYLLPILYLIYVDVVSYIYWRELRKAKKRVSLRPDIEY